MSATASKRDVTIRFRAESELKTKLERIAPIKKKRFSEFMREEMWKLVQREETATAKKAKR